MCNNQLREEPGEIGNANLRLDAELGRGAFGVVHKGTFQGRVIAAKRIHPLLLEYARHSREEFDKIQTDFERYVNYDSTLSLTT